MLDIASFLAKNPSVSQILEFVEQESQRIARDRKKQAAQGAQK